MIEPATTNRMMFFMTLCSIFDLLFTAWFGRVMTLRPPSLTFVEPIRMHSACARLPVQKLFLSGSLSCSAKIQFLPATYLPLPALLPFHRLRLRWVYFRQAGLAALDQRGQSVDQSRMVNENEEMHVNQQTG